MYLLIVLGGAAGLASIAYLLLAIWHVARFDARPRVIGGAQPPVTILKPICGDEPLLYECLRSFCTQDYGILQIVFGVHNPADTAIPVIRRLIAEFPDRDLSLVIDTGVHGVNRKVGNLVNMYPHAKHDIIIVSDSDVCAPPETLARVVAELGETRIGAATCLYKAAPAGGLASSLGGLFINDWFLASAIVDAGLNPVDYCFGPLTAVRRAALEAIGGFPALAGHLADDYMLGQLISRAGYGVRLSRHCVDTIVAEDFRSLLSHELRWARTVKAVKPLEYFLSIVMQALPITCLLLLPPAGALGAGILASAVALRIVLHYVLRAKFDICERPRPWLVPLRELLCFAIWLAAYRSRDVLWRDRIFSVTEEGELVAIAVVGGQAAE